MHLVNDDFRHLDTKRLDQLSRLLEVTKLNELAAKEARLKVEQDIINLMGVKAEGSYTYKTNQYKVTTIGNVSRKLDVMEYERIKGKIPEELRPVAYKYEIKQSLIHNLQRYHPDLYKQMTRCMTTKENKPSVKVEAI